MADLIIPRGLRHARSTFSYVDQTGVSRGAYNGIAQTTGYGGDHIAATIDFTQHGGQIASDKRLAAQLRAFLMSLKGKQNRPYIADESYKPGGSFPASELFTNTDFSGTTGWSSDSMYSLSAADGLLRSTAIASNATGFPAYQTLSKTLYVPYAVRALVLEGRGTFSPSMLAFLENNSYTALANGIGYALYGAAAQVASDNAGLATGSTGIRAGDYIDIAFMSFARCFLADGYPNSFVQSGAADNAAWTKDDLTVVANDSTNYDGTATGDTLVETAVNSDHFIQQQVSGLSASAADYFVGFVVKKRNRTFCAIQMTETTGSTSASQYFDLTTGAATGAPGTGANWANNRSGVVALGNDWFYCWMIARKTNAATAINAYLFSASAAGTSVYLGTGVAALTFGGSVFAQSSVAVRLSTTTTAAATATSQTGSAIHVKGLPASTSGLLLMGDWVEIDGQIKMVLTSLNSDASGVGHLRFSPPLRRPLANDTPIIVHRPMGRFLYAGDSVSWDNEPGVFTRSTIELEEAFAP